MQAQTALGTQEQKLGSSRPWTKRERGNTCHDQRAHFIGSKMPTFLASLEWDRSYNQWHLEAIKYGSCSTSTEKHGADATNTQVCSMKMICFNN